MFLPGESQGRGRLAGCHLWGRIESDTTEVTQQQQQQQGLCQQMLSVCVNLGHLSCVIQMIFQRHLFLGGSTCEGMVWQVQGTYVYLGRVVPFPLGARLGKQNTG